MVSDGCVGQTVVRDRRVYTVGSCSPVGEVVQHTGELGRWWVGPGPLGARLARAQARVLPEHLAAKTGSQTYLQRKPNQVEVINGVKTRRHWQRLVGSGVSCLDSWRLRL